MPEQLRGSIIVWGAAAVVVVLALLRLLDARGRPARRAREARAPARRGGPRGGGLSGLRARGRAPSGGPACSGSPRGHAWRGAIERAGGPARKAALAGVNLAARVQDGATDRRRWPARPEGRGPRTLRGRRWRRGRPWGQAEPGVGHHRAAGPEDGIGPTLAERIVEQRQENGGFASVEELGEVEGIGEKRLGDVPREALQP